MCVCDTLETPLGREGRRGSHAGQRAWSPLPSWHCQGDSKRPESLHLHTVGVTHLLKACQCGHCQCESTQLEVAGEASQLPARPPSGAHVLCAATVFGGGASGMHTYGTSWALMLVLRLSGLRQLFFWSGLLKGLDGD